MKPQGNVEIYRVAFDAANSELAEISAEFERLRIRKEHIEKLVLVLQPLIAEGEEGAESGLAAKAVPQAETAGEAPAGVQSGRKCSLRIHFSAGSITCWGLAAASAT